MNTASAAVTEAASVIANRDTKIGWAGIRRLVRALKAEFDFATARRLLTFGKEDCALAASAADLIWATQQLALCTYKDEELPQRQRLDDAERILEGAGLRDPGTTDGETLALGGAVFKHRWAAGGQLDDMHEALAFYRAAWERAPETGRKLYAAVNACYLMDVLASRARAIANRTGTPPDASVNIVREADDLRHAALKLAASTGADADYWDEVSIAELHLGLGRTNPAEYELARQRCARAAQKPGREGEGAEPREWELQSTFHQMSALLRCQGVPPANEPDTIAELNPPWRAVAELLGESALLALAGNRGKVGLALSGGGFRASLFHLGVLARLAEVGALRSVEALSTVSGGSIVGAHYYLEVQRMLERTPDSEISTGDYVELVSRLQKRFLAGVQRNMRMRALLNLGDNLKVAFTKSYTYSRRLGELYESVLYSSVEDEKGHRERAMCDLRIAPHGSGGAFKPKFSGWRRRAKVPILLLNACSMNSGHNWQFTARWMGEPPGRLNTDVDANTRYRRLWYEDAPTPPLQRFRLGHAVAASACVPGLFEPIVLPDLYPGRTVRLVDGGVHDNQGVAGLLDEACTLVLVSDASGQMDDQSNPPNGRIGVPLRSNSILMDRVREAEYEDLQSRVESRALQGLLFVHLKADLDVRPLDWIGCRDEGSRPVAASPRTDYGIDKELQRMLAAVRTDLDSFTEIEANALMLSGYLMTEHQLHALDVEHRRSGATGTWGNFAIDAPRGNWGFLRLAKLMAEPPNSTDPRRAELGRQLHVGASLVFKAFKLHRPLRMSSLVVGGAVVVGGIAAVIGFWSTEVTLVEKHTSSVGGMALGAGFFLVALVMPALAWLKPHEAARSVGLKILGAFAGWLVALIHLAFFDRLYLRAGTIDRLLGRE